MYLADPLNKQKQAQFKKILRTKNLNNTKLRISKKFVISQIALIIFLIIFFQSQIGVQYLPISQVKPQKKQNITFKDVFGIDQHREQFQQVVDFLKNPSKYIKMGAQLPRGLLLVGNPGTGKTLLARALAGQAGCNLFYKSGSQFDEIFVGLGARRIRSLFSQAKKKSPSIIFIDQIDSIAGKRKESSKNYHRAALNQLLTQMDGFNTSDNIVVIGATNFQKVLDPAIKRPGRFDKIIHIPLPDKKGRQQLILYYLNKIKYGSISIKDLVGETQGFSGADIQNMINISIINAVKQGKQLAQKENFQYALQRVRLGIKSTRIQSQNQKKATAIHQSGHALVAMLTPKSPQVRKITIRGAGPAKGYTSFHNNNEDQKLTKSQLKAMIDVSMGGRVAQQLFLGQKKVSSGCSDDLKKASNMAYNLINIEKEGIFSVISSDISCSDKFQFEIDQSAQQVLNKSYKRVKQLLENNRSKLQKMARILIQKETIDSEQIKDFIV